MSTTETLCGGLISAASRFFLFTVSAPQTSTSGSYNMPARASNSDLVVHRTIFGQHSWLYGRLLTLTQVFTRVLRSIVSSFISVSSSRSNTVGVHTPPPTPRLSEPDFIIASLHTVYAYLTGLLLTLTGLKYQGCSTSPFDEHPTLIMFFLIVVFVYIIALITLMRSNSAIDHCPNKVMLVVCHISGALACELLLLVLVSPMKSFVINVSSFALIVMLVVLCYKYGGTEEQGSEMVDLEAPPISTA